MPRFCGSGYKETDISNYYLTRSKGSGYTLRTEAQHRSGHIYPAVICFCAREFHKVTGFRLKLGETQQVRVNIEVVK